MVLAWTQPHDLAVNRLALLEAPHGAGLDALAALADDFHALTVVAHTTHDGHVAIRRVAARAIFARACRLASADDGASRGSSRR
jgi:hypothetical protein